MSLLAPVSPPHRTQYSLESCAACGGGGFKCASCRGNGLVLVRQPAMKCLHCHGSGIERNRPASASPLCVNCSGAGWEDVIGVK